MQKASSCCSRTLASFRSTDILSRRAPAFFLKNSKAMATSNSEVENDLISEASVPNETWSEKTKKLYDELMNSCKDGKWEKIKSFRNFTANERLFTRAVEEKGKMYEYAMFLNKEENRLRGVVQFGPWLQGPKGAVHGGAIAALFDSMGGVLAYQLGYRCVTVNLNVNFHGFLPLYTTAECIAWVKKMEGRKIFIDAELKSLDGKTIFDKCSALWLRIDGTSDEITKE